MATRWASTTRAPLKSSTSHNPTGPASPNVPVVTTSPWGGVDHHSPDHEAVGSAGRSRAACSSPARTAARHRDRSGRGSTRPSQTRCHWSDASSGASQAWTWGDATRWSATRANASRTSGRAQSRSSPSGPCQYMAASTDVLSASRAASAVTSARSTAPSAATTSATVYSGVGPPQPKRVMAWPSASARRKDTSNTDWTSALASPSRSRACSDATANASSTRRPRGPASRSGVVSMGPSSQRCCRAAAQRG